MKARFFKHITPAITPAITVLAGLLCAAAPAHAITISATATAASSQPGPVALTQDLVNGDFTIGANPAAGPGHVTGDGVDETTRWAFDFTADPGYAAFMATGGLVEARLRLTLNTQFFINGVGPSTDVALPSDGVTGLFPAWTLPSFINGVAGNYNSGSIVTSLVSQVGMNPAELFNWLSSHGGLFPMRYADDALVTAADLTLVSAPVPEPHATLLMLAGAGLLLARRRRMGQPA
ncbi:PEP-CTERM domain-containing protein [Rubrivivax sp. A210]|uniref:PEP-CTERM sorting domain-containing protein n=1 Tax=Rubrivivax sp. A210 TaxID=2772301 RepID=UPI001918E976|nr:PEP-CTERM sorting domain-containing protein [Rubrivivax sp. A210]CAD5371747.1 PEP-CTERM domain-containing protein [Rubrivivax sp. A210]